MTEQETTTRLNDYLDGELSPAQVASFEAELSKDPALRAEMETVQSALELLRTEGPLQAPTGFHERVMAQAAVEPMPQVGWMDRLRSFFRELPMETLAMAVAATIVLVLVGGLLPDSDEPETEPATMEPAETELSTAAGAQDKKDTVKSKEAAPGPEKELDPFREVADTLITGPIDEGEGSGTVSKTQAIDGVVGLESSTGGNAKDGALKGSDSKSVDPKGTADVMDLGSQEPVGSTSGAEKPDAGEAQAIDLEAQLNAAVAYSLVVKDSTSLRQIAALAERHGGRAVNAKTGAALSESDLDDGRVQVQVRIPPAQLASFHSALNSIGAAQRTSMNDANLYGPDTISLNLDVRIK